LRDHVELVDEYYYCTFVLRLLYVGARMTDCSHSKDTSS
jgi:hypothetical protein